MALAPIGAYLAVTGVFNWLPLLFSFTVLFWVSGFDIIYALQDEAFDRENKLKSIPVLLGTKNTIVLKNYKIIYLKKKHMANPKNLLINLRVIKKAEVLHLEILKQMKPFTRMS